MLVQPSVVCFPRPSQLWRFPSSVSLHPCSIGLHAFSSRVVSVPSLLSCSCRLACSSSPSRWTCTSSSSFPPSWPAPLLSIVMLSLDLAAFREVPGLLAFSERIGPIGQLGLVICCWRFGCHSLASCIHSSSLREAVEHSTWPSWRVIWLLFDCLAREA